jgi:hypothetical protein
LMQGGRGRVRYQSYFPDIKWPRPEVHDGEATCVSPGAALASMGGSILQVSFLFKTFLMVGLCFEQAHMGRGIHDLLKVSPGPAMPNPSTPCRWATPKTALRSFWGWLVRRAGGLRPSSTPLDTPGRTGLVLNQCSVWIPRGKHPCHPRQHHVIGEVHSGKKTIKCLRYYFF